MKCILIWPYLVFGSTYIGYVALSTIALHLHITDRFHLHHIYAYPLTLCPSWLNRLSDTIRLCLGGQDETILCQPVWPIYQACVSWKCIAMVAQLSPRWRSYRLSGAVNQTVLGLIASVAKPKKCVVRIYGSLSGSSSTCVTFETIQPQWLLRLCLCGLHVFL